MLVIRQKKLECQTKAYLWGKSQDRAQLCTIGQKPVAQFVKYLFVIWKDFAHCTVNSVRSQST